MKYAYWLHNIPGFGNGKIRQLYKEVVCAEELYEMALPQLRKIGCFTEEDIKNGALSKGSYLKKIVSIGGKKGYI